MLVTGQQVNVPGDGHAEIRIVYRPIAPVVKKKDIKVHDPPVSYPLIKGRTILDWMSFQHP